MADKYYPKCCGLNASVYLMTGNLVPLRQIRDELINHKALVTEKLGYVQINFSIYFKYKEVHDFAANQLEIMNNNLEIGLSRE